MSVQPARSATNREFSRTQPRTMRMSRGKGLPVGSSVNGFISSRVASRSSNTARQLARKASMEGRSSNGRPLTRGASTSPAAAQATAGVMFVETCFSMQRVHGWHQCPSVASVGRGACRFAQVLPKVHVHVHESLYECCRLWPCNIKGASAHHAPPVMETAVGMVIVLTLSQFSSISTPPAVENDTCRFSTITAYS